MQMIRLVAAIAVVLILSPAVVRAQGTELTVNLASANVYKGPSTGSPVIGKALRGTVLEVTRELGDWVKVTWADAPDAVGYVHVSAGALAPRGTSVPGNAPAVSAPRSVSSSRAVVASGRPVTDPLSQRTTQLLEEPTSAHTHPAQQAEYVNPPSHRFGVGGQVSGSTLGFGVGGRVWARKGLGVQFDLSRYTQTNPAVPGRLTSLQLAPSALYSLADRVNDYFWLRPYVGAGISMYRQSLSDPAVPGVSVSDSTTGYQAFGGAEITFPSMPRFALSADVGYRWPRDTPFAGFELGGLGFTLAGHWYVK
jgi:SH3 domain-containing protein/outer membrane protein with beta-barrel domain